MSTLKHFKCKYNHQPTVKLFPPTPELLFQQDFKDQSYLKSIYSHKQGEGFSHKKEGPLWTAGLEDKTITRLNSLRVFFKHLFAQLWKTVCKIESLAWLCVSVSLLAHQGAWTCNKRTAVCQLGGQQ